MHKTRIRTELTIEVPRVRDRLLARPWASRVTVRRPSPVAANGDIEDELLGQEVAEDVALRVREERGGRAPAGRVGLLVLDVLRDIAAVEEPDGDALALERVGEDAAGLHVEEVAEGVVTLLLVRTPGIVAVRGLALCAGYARDGLCGAVEQAAWPAVEGDLILDILVDALWADVEIADQSLALSRDCMMDDRETHQ